MEIKKLLSPAVRIVGSRRCLVITTFLGLLTVIVLGALLFITHSATVYKILEGLTVAFVLLAAITLILELSGITEMIGFKKATESERQTALLIFFAGAIVVIIAHWC